MNNIVNILTRQKSEIEEKYKQKLIERENIEKIAKNLERK